MGPRTLYVSFLGRIILQLDTVLIEGFRSIAGPARVAVESPTILAGHNDAGKSAVIDAIAFLLDSYKVTERDLTYSKGEDGAETTHVDRMVVTGTFTLADVEQTELGIGEKVSLRRVSEGGASGVWEQQALIPEDTRLRDYAALTVEKLKDRLNTLSLPTTGQKPDLLNRLNVAATTAPKIMAWSPASASLRKHLPRVQRFDAMSSQDAEEAIKATLQSSYRAHLDSEGMQGTVAELTAQIEDLVKADAEALRAHIIEKCEGIGGVDIRPVVRLSAGLAATEVSITNSRGEDVNLGQSGTGRSRRVALAVWEYNAQILKDSEESVVLLYDEPDTHLDYRHQRGFMRILRAQSALPHVRAVVATHSMNLIDGVDIASVHHVRHVDDRTIIGTLTDDSDVGKHLGAIAASIGIRNTVLLHERLFVGVEGDSEARALPVLFKLATGHHLASCGIALWPCNNNDGALRFAAYLAAHGRDVVFLVDRDSLENKIFSDQSLHARGLDPIKHRKLAGDLNEIEDTFTDAQWAATANRHWPRTDGAEWQEDAIADLRSQKFSKALYDLIRADASSSPSGKPEMLVTLALDLESMADVPTSLTAVFHELIALAD